MRPRLSFYVLLFALSAFTIEGRSFAQVTRVNVMPGYPNAPRTSPAQRRPVRPNDTLILWGSANDGVGTANGYTYTWSITTGPDLTYVDDGSLTGPVQDDSYITEEIAFSLMGGATSAIATATLSVTDGTLTMQDTVEFAVIGTTDPLSDTPLENQQVDVNIAIEDGLRWLYRRLQLNGKWSHPNTLNEVGPTGYSLWAMQNQGHLPTNDSDEDILAMAVQEGLDFLFMKCEITSNIAAPNATVALGATAPQISDINSNGQSVSIGQQFGHWGYAHCIATAALAATVSPNRVVTVGPCAGMTYKELGEDCLDLIGFGQVDAGVPRGGWSYTPNNWTDMSINSWAYVAMEGLYVTFGVDIPDWILQECEHSLIYHQANQPGAVPFGYTSPFRLNSPVDGHATTGGGLSGLYAVELTGPHAVGGSVIGLEAPPLNSISAKRNAALDYLGENWNELGCGIGNGNLGNTYAMWTVARALRLTAFGLGLPAGDVVQLTNQSVSFDWETGEQSGSGAIAAAGTSREGYFTYLLRTQEADPLNSVDDRGRWDFGCFGQDLDTAMAVLVLTPKVFLVDPPEEEQGDQDLGCEEFNRTETLTANDTLSLLTLAHNPEAAQGFAYVHAVDDEGAPIGFDHLIGQLLVVDGIESFDYSVNAVDYRAAVSEGVMTDFDADGVRDLDGVEYEMTAGELLIPRFFGQSSDTEGTTPFNSELLLIGLTGGNKFTTTADFLVYNDNEEVFSAEHSFDCWTKTPLVDISGVFTNSFLRDNTDHASSEPVGFSQYETGWMRINGGVAVSEAASFADPAVYAVLIEHAQSYGAADLPFEVCQQAGQLLPRGVIGDLSGPGPSEDCSASIPRREPASLLLMPEFDNRNGVATIYSITNTSETEGVDVHFVYIGKYGS
jgi:hypothetical protein